jgi:RNA polymerase sigma-70 factor (ECF subfamily)
MTDRDLCDPARFHDAYHRLRPLALAAATRVLHDEVAAEDVVQEVFLDLWRRPRSYDPSRGSLRHYVTMLARSRAVDRWRTRSVRDAAIARMAQEAPPEVALGESADEPAIRRERSHRLLGALEELPSEQREALLLAYGRGLTSHEIARVARVPLGTAKSRVRLGLEKARAQLGVAA